MNNFGWVAQDWKEALFRVLFTRPVEVHTGCPVFCSELQDHGHFKRGLTQCESLAFALGIISAQTCVLDS